MITIGPGTTVTLHFAIKLEDGTVIDSNFDTKPATFQYGDGNLLPGFEQALVGFKTGDKANLRILPEQGFGQHNPNNVQIMQRQGFAADMVLEPGLMLSFAAADKTELPGVVAKVEDDSVTVDFNHPLAGRTLFFEVEILRIQ